MAEAMQTLAVDRLGGRLGMMVVLHTWGRTLQWHPHVHCLVPGVVVSDDGAWRKVGGKGLLPLVPLSIIYRAILLRMIRGAKEAPMLPKIPWSKQWVVNSRGCVEGPANVLSYHARYTKRGPLPEQRIESVSDDQIVFRYTSHRTKRVERCELTPEEFLRRYLQHTPSAGCHRIRYYGLLAPGARAKLRGLRVAMMAALALLAPTVAKLRERFEQRNEQVCPRCGGRTFIHREFRFAGVAALGSESPNRRAPPWQQAA